MTNNIVKPQVTALVRQFILGLDNDNESLLVEQALTFTANEAAASEVRKLSDARNFNEWLQFKYPPSDKDTQLLQLQCQKVTKLWAEFGHRFNGTSRGNSLPSVDDLYSSVGTAASELNQKRLGTRGKIADGFQSFVGALSDHSYIFSIIPDNDKYLSLVTGVLTSIAKVAINRRTITEAFASELEEIREELKDVPKVVDVGNRTEMLPRVVTLYIRIFEFLYEAMCWYQSKSKRFKTYLNENYHARHFSPLTSNIRKAIASISRNADQMNRDRLRYLVHRADLNMDNRIASDDTRYQSEDTLGAKRGRLLEGFKKIGNDARDTLYAGGEQFFYDQEQKALADASLAAQVEEQLDLSHVSTEPETEEDNVNWVSRTELRRQADLLLAAFTDDGREELKNILRGNASPKIPEEVSVRIQSWIQNKGSQLLWVDGPIVMGSGSSLSLTALRIYELTMHAGIPCVSFFCKRKYGIMSPESTTSGATLMALLYTIIDQLINLLPPSFESTTKINLENLDINPPGGSKVATAALGMVEQLLSYAPPAVTFIVDGLELVSNTTELPYLVRLVELLRTAGGGDKVFKVLLTTNGNSMALGKAIHWKERVDGSRFAQGRPGKLLRGATDLSEIR
ncbi:hypothetical protein PG987_004955 [Apiospora arundinis]